MIAAGARIVAAYDFDKKAVAAHKALLPDCPVERVDLAALERVPDAELWWASPPCQPFSTAGERLGSADPRNGYPHLLRLLERPPRWLVIENVPGLQQHQKAARCSPMWPKPNDCVACYLHTVMVKLRVLYPAVELRKLCAADYGVPQERYRLITVCGPRPIDWPAPTHAKHPTNGLERWVGAGRALGLQILGGGTNPHGKGRAHERTLRDLTDAPATTVTGEAGNNSLLAIEYGGTRGGKGQAVKSADESAPTVGTAGDLRLAIENTQTSMRKQGRVRRMKSVDEPADTVKATSAAMYLSVGGPNARDGRGPSERELDDPAPSVRTHADIYIMAGGTGGVGLPTSTDEPSPTITARRAEQLVDGEYRRIRTLTVRERAILQDLPWHDSLTSRTVGNAVPPTLARVVVAAVLAADRVQEPEPLQEQAPSEQQQLQRG